jgi:hypothetical protein
MERRTKIDFSKHKLKITQLKGVLIHEFKRPDTRSCMLVFINACGTMMFVCPIIAAAIQDLYLD